jgi:hypothetical protein
MKDKRLPQKDDFTVTTFSNVGSKL